MAGLESGSGQKNDRETTNGRQQRRRIVSGNSRATNKNKVWPTEHVMRGRVGISNLFSWGFALIARVGGLVLLVWAVDFVRFVGKSLEPLPGITFGVKFSLPFDFPSIEGFYDFPMDPGFSVQLPFSPQMGPIFAVLLVIYPILFAFIQTIYLGILNAARLGQTVGGVGKLLRTYYLNILSYELLWFFLLVLLLPLAFSPGIFVLGILGLFVFWYLTFLTPFAIIASHLNFRRALVLAVDQSTRRAGILLPYVVVYGLITAAVSVPIFLLMNASLPGFIASTLLVAIIGTGLVASTFYLLDYLRGVYSWPTHPTLDSSNRDSAHATQ